MDTLELQKIKQRYNIVGNSDGLNRALDTALKAAPIDISVLIIGESGVGKDVIPRIIHDNSPRRREKYFAINCGSIPEGTIDSELFGHEKGSFTGAVGESEGYFGVANKGTIFLDEVGELPMATQARLLRVLENGEYIRVGGQKVMKTDVRVVAATNVNMRKAIVEGRFREDLFYRLNGINIQMPPLRDRGTDIVLLFRLFAMQIADKYKMPKITLTDDAKELLMKYKWPGNVRQLKNLTEQISVLSTKREINAEELSKYIPVDAETTELAPLPDSNKHPYETERELLYKALYELKGNVANLQQEVNQLKEKIVNKDNAIAYSNNSLPAINNALITDYSRATGTNKQIEDADAEEISEKDTLNLNDIGRQVVEKALERNNGNRKKAAHELGISDRTLYRRIKQYGLDKEK